MSRTMLACTLVLVCVAGYITAAGTQSSPQSQQAVISKYCAGCHNEKLKTADVTLDKADIAHAAENPALWEKVLHKLRSREMPPPRVIRPDEAMYESLTAYLETALDKAAIDRPNPGRPAVYRLNRLQYTNAIHDLLDLEFDSASLLPADDSGYGFDNIGDVLSVSPSLLEKYLAAAAKISRLAIGDPKLSPTSTEYQIAADKVQTERESFDLPIGSRGGIAVRHHFPLDAEYVIKVRLQRGKDATNILGMVESHQLDILIDGKRIKSFTVGGQTRARGGDEEGAADNSSLDNGLEVRVSLAAGPHLIGVTFLKDTIKAEGLPASDRAQAFFEGVGSVSIAGPYNAKGSGDTPSREKIFVCRPGRREEDDTCAAKILTNLARRAYRRPIRNDEIAALLAPYNLARDEGGFEQGIR